jgi:hypothetical protein
MLLWPSKNSSKLVQILCDRKQKTEIKSLNKFSSKWGTVKHGVPQGSIVRPLLFIIYSISDLPPMINNLSKPILFTDDTNVIISGKSFDDISAVSNSLLSHMSKWFTYNK